MRNEGRYALDFLSQTKKEKDQDKETCYRAFLTHIEMTLGKGTAKEDKGSNYLLLQR